MARVFGRLWRDRRGATAVEYAFVLPILMLLLMGMGYYGQMFYGRALLNGAVRQASRDSTLENANTTTLDQNVANVLAPALPGVTVSSTRKSYYDFTDIGRAEKWTDSNANGRCDNGEPYTDENGDGSWNSDIGSSGNGAAGDIIVYTATATYTPMFSVPFMKSMWGKVTLNATAVRRNQPWAAQVAYGSATRTCT